MGTAASGTAAVGTIKVVVGDVKVVGVDGVARQAMVGDKVFAKETIQTNANAIVQVQLENGRMLDLGRDSKIALDDDVLNVGQGGGATPTPAPATGDIAALQAQIAAGADPSKVAEATAAGGAPGAGGTADGSGGTPVYIDQANSSGEVTSGYTTSVGGITFSELQPALPPVQTPPVISISVQVAVQASVTPTEGETPVDINDDGQLEVGSANVVEGTAETTKTVNFIITLDKVFDTDVTVTYTVVGITALAGTSNAYPTDFTEGDNLLRHTVTIPAGQSSFIVPVEIVQDNYVEGTESFQIVLLSATNATINPDASSAVVNIFDDDRLTFSVSVNDSGPEAAGTAVGISEEAVGNDDGGVADNAATFTITMGGAMLPVGNSASVVLNFPGTATDGIDYTSAIEAAIAAATGSGITYNATTNTLTFTGGGATSLSFTVTAVNDDLLDSGETITVSLSNPIVALGLAPVIGTASATATISDIDQSITFSVAVNDSGPEAQGTAVGISEENLADNAATFTVSISQALNVGNSASVVLNFPGSAEDGVDYTAAIEAAIAAATGSGVSYDAETSTLTFIGGGATSLSFTVTAVNDDNLDSGETIQVQLSNASIDEGVASISQDLATATISDIDQRVSFSVVVNDEGEESSGALVGISEESESDNAATFTVSISPALNVGNSASVVLEFPGDATDNVDYTDAIEAAIAAATGGGISYDSETNTLTFTGGGATSLSFTVTAVNDDNLDSGETIQVQLSNASINEGVASISQDLATATITDVDQAITITIADTRTTITEEGGETDTFTISLSEAIKPGNVVTVDVDFATGTTTENADFVIAAQAALQAIADSTAGVSFNGTTLTYDSTFVGTTLSFSVTAFNDDELDSPETLNITLGNATALNGSATAADSENVTITDQDQAITITIADTRTTITEEGGETDTFTISLSEAIKPGNVVTVDVDFATGTTTENADFVIAAQAALQAIADSTAGVSFNGTTLTYDSTFVGTTLSFSVTAFNDDELDSPETLNITLGNATALNGSATAADSENVTITDQDQAITITIADTRTTITEEGGETDTFTISLSEAIKPGNVVTVDVDFATGTTTENADFVIAAQAALQAIADSTAGVSFNGTTLTYDSTFVGTTLSFSVTAFNDDELDSPETLNITLGNATALNGSATAADSENVTITDQDQAITITIADTRTTITEEGGETDTFTISLSEAIKPGNVVTVDVDFATGTTTENADFVIAAQAALQAIADSTAGVSFNGTTLTYDSTFVGTTLSFSVTAFNDDELDSPETLNITLGNATALNGSATAADSENVTITDQDQAITITIADTRTTITEEGGETDTFTISLSEAIKPGNVVTVDVDFATGTTTENADFVIAAQAALQAIADSTAGVSFNGTTLTYDSTFVGTTLSFSVTAFNDDELDSPETLNITLGNATALNGSATAADSENVTITDQDQAITITIADTRTTITEEGGETDTFTISLSEAIKPGNVVTVDVDFATGTTTENADFVIAAQAALQAIADSTAGVSFNGTTLTYDSTFVGTTLSFSVTAFNDDELDSPETLNITLGNATALNGSATAADSENVTITDQDQAITITIADTRTTITEEGGETDTFTISLSEAIKPGNVVTVDVDFATGTTTENADFVIAAQAALQAIADSTAGVSFNGTTLTYDSTFVGTTLSFSVTAFNDDELDSPETLNITLGNATALNGSATAADSENVTITDQDQAITITIADTRTTITEEGGETDTFTISLSEAIKPGNVVTVDVDFATGTTTENADFVIAAQAALQAIADSTAGVSFNGTTLTYDSTFVGTTLSFSVTAFNDDELDSPETLNITLGNATALNGSATAADSENVTITDQDQAITITIADTRTTITEEGGETDTFTISLSEAIKPGNVVTVDVDFATGTTTENADFVIAAQAALQAIADSTAGVSFNGTTLTYDSTFVGTTLSFSVTAFNDDELDSPETLNITLGNATALNGSATAADSENVTITDQDQAITITIADTRTTITEEGGETDTFTISLSEAIKPGNVVTVDVDFATGTTTENADFVIAAQAALQAIADSTAGVSFNGTTLTYDSTFVGTTLSFSVTAFNDDELDSPETLNITLGNATALNGSATAADSENVTITDQDQAITITIADTRTTITEEGGETDTFTISLSEAIKPGNVVTVDVDFATGTTTENADFVIAAQAALQAIADSTAGVSFNGTTLTYDSTFVGTTLSFSVTAFNDDELDSPETLNITLGNATALNGSATAADSENVTITDQDQAITITIADTRTTITEEGGETDTFTISLSEAIKPGNVVTVDVDFATGTTTENADFVIAAQAALQAIADSTAGVSFNGTTLTYDSTFVGTTLSFSVTAFNDDELDSPETLNITLGNATALNGSATAADSENVTITDQDQAITITIADTRTTITEEGGETDTFTISLSEAIKPGNVVTVDVDFATGTTTENADFVIAAQAALQAIADSTAGVSFNGTTLTYDSTFVGTTLSFSVTAFNDDELDSPETLNITLGNATALNGSATAADSENVTITDQDQAITITIADTRTTITEEGGETDTFTISLSEAIKPGNVVTVDVDFATGTTTENADFVIAAQAALQAIADSTAGVSFNGTTLTYDSTFVGTTLSFSVTAFNDDELDSPETLNITLGNATALNGSATAADSENVTITDQDQAITITIADTRTTITEEGGETDTFTISLSEAIKPGNVVTVDVDFATGTTTENADFVIAAQAALQAIADSTAGVSFNGTTLTYDSTFVGTTLSFSVTAFNDDELDSPETLNITLGNATALNGSATAADSENVTITDIDEAVTFGITVTSTDAANDTPSTLANISEENAGDNQGTFTIAMVGYPLNTGNTASVTVTIGGTTETGVGGDFTSSVISAIQAGALAAGVGFVDNGDGTVTLTWTSASTSGNVAVNLTAFNDTASDSPETLTLTLGTATISEGTANIVGSQADLTINDFEARLLNGVMITNTNVTNQFITLGFTEVLTTYHSAAKIYDLSLQGQQGVVVQDVGFMIDPNQKYQVSVEASAGTKAIITDLTLEGALIQGSGNAQLEKNNTSSTSSDSTAITAVIDPDTAVAVQAKTESTDGTSAGNTLTDATPLTVNYLYGADGADTLTGGAGADILNGGAGTDSLNGGDGNDILVFDNANNDVIVGGAGIDLLRVDDGALALSLAGSANNSNTLGPANNVVVNLTSKAISGIEGILITEEAGQSTVDADPNTPEIQNDPNDDVGTTIVLNANDVLTYSDTDKLRVLGSLGDKVQLNSAEWNTTGVAQTADSQGQVFVLYSSTTTAAKLFVESEVQVTFV